MADYIDRTEHSCADCNWKRWDSEYHLNMCGYTLKPCHIGEYCEMWKPQEWR